MNSSKKQMKNGNIYLVIALIVVIILFYSSSQTYGQQSQVSRLESWLPNQPFKDTLAGIRFNYGGSMVSIDHLGYAKFLEFFFKEGRTFRYLFYFGRQLVFRCFPKLKIWWLTAILAWLSATGYAGLDEFHQMMTGGRTPMFQDVMLIRSVL
ncbi:VanZ family protein [Enterococcus faecium]|nr:VanZ family protein [Enterococcus faecium]